MRFGCHTSTWVLDYDKELDIVDQLINDLKVAPPFSGLDIQVALLGKYLNNPIKLKETLDANNITLASLTVPFGWEDGIESEEEKKRFNYFVDFLKHFDNKPIFNMPIRNGKNRENLRQKQEKAINIINEVAKRGYNQGIQVSFHPASPQTSYFRTADDYELLLNNLDFEYISYTPDTGHIMYGGMNPLEIIKKYRPYIKHVHIKDCSLYSEWKKLGQGDVQVKEILQFLKETNYSGWVMFEEETYEASIAPSNVIKDMGTHISKLLLEVGEYVK